MFKSENQIKLETIVDEARAEQPREYVGSKQEALDSAYDNAILSAEEGMFQLYSHEYLDNVLSSYYSKRDDQLSGN